MEEQSDIYQELIREHGPVFKKRNKSEHSITHYVARLLTQAVLDDKHRSLTCTGALHVVCFGLFLYKHSRFHICIHYPTQAIFMGDLPKSETRIHSLNIPVQPSLLSLKVWVRRHVYWYAEHAGTFLGIFLGETQRGDAFTSRKFSSKTTRYTAFREKHCL